MPRKRLTEEEKEDRARERRQDALQRRIARNLMSIEERADYDRNHRQVVLERKEARLAKKRLCAKGYADGYLTKACKQRKRKRGVPRVKTFGPKIPRAVRAQLKAEGIRSGYLTKAGKVRKRSLTYIPHTDPNAWVEKR